MHNGKWWMEEGGKANGRLIAEVKAMQTTFPKLFRLENLKSVNPADRLYWVGDIDLKVNDPKVTPGEKMHTIKIEYPADFPAHAPNCYCLTEENFLRNGEPMGSYSPHNRGGGLMCIFNWTDTVNHGWNPAKSTAATIASWGIEWLYATLLWCHTGKWPGVEHVILDEELRGRRSAPSVRPVHRGSGESVVRSRNLAEFAARQGGSGRDDVVPGASNEPDNHSG